MGNSTPHSAEGKASFCEGRFERGEFGFGGVLECGVGDEDLEADLTVDDGEVNGHGLGVGQGDLQNQAGLGGVEGSGGIVVGRTGEAEVGRGLGGFVRRVGKEDGER